MSMTFNRVSLPVSQAAANCSFTITTSTGNGMAVAIVTDSGGTVSQVTDNLNQTYALTSRATSPGGNCLFAICEQSAPGVTTIKCTNASTGVSIAAYDVTSSSYCTIIDNIHIYTAQTGASISMTLTAQPLCVALAIECDNAAANQSAVTSPFTFDAMNAANTVDGESSAHDQSAAGGSLTATFSGGGTPANWSGIIISLISSVDTPANATVGPSYAI